MKYLTHVGEDPFVVKETFVDSKNVQSVFGTDGKELPFGGVPGLLHSFVGDGGAGRLVGSLEGNGHASAIVDYTNEKRLYEGYSRTFALFGVGEKWAAVVEIGEGENTTKEVVVEGEVVDTYQGFIGAEKINDQYFYVIGIKEENGKKFIEKKVYNVSSK